MEKLTDSQYDSTPHLPGFAPVTSRVSGAPSTSGRNDSFDFVLLRSTPKKFTVLKNPLHPVLGTIDTRIN